MMAVDPGVVGVEVPLFPALRIGSDRVVRRAEEEIELLREKEFSSLSPDTPRRGGRMEEGLGREERFSGLLVTPSLFPDSEYGKRPVEPAEVGCVNKLSEDVALLVALGQAELHLGDFVLPCKAGIFDKVELETLSFACLNTLGA